MGAKILIMTQLVKKIYILRGKNYELPLSENKNIGHEAYVQLRIKGVTKKTGQLMLIVGYGEFY